MYNNYNRHCTDPACTDPHHDHNRRSGSYAPVLRLRNDIDRLFDGMFNDMFPWNAFGMMPVLNRAAEREALRPSLDVSRTDQAYTVKVELPGVKPEDIQLELRDNVLILKGEKKSETKDEKKDYYVSECSYGSFERALTPPDDVKIEDITAAHKDGVLTITLPRREERKPVARNIEINKA